MRRVLAGRGSVEVSGQPDRVWSALLDPAVLRSLIPGADRVERLDDSQYDDSRYHALLSFGVGRVRSRYDVRLDLSRAVAPHRLDLAGDCTGLLGGGHATAHVVLTEAGPGRTVLTWSYDGAVTGPVALAGAALLRVSSTLFIQKFFAALARHVARTTGEAGPPAASFQPHGSERPPELGLVRVVARRGGRTAGGVGTLPVQNRHDGPP